jgi:hypothetical protein
MNKVGIRGVCFACFRNPATRPPEPTPPPPKSCQLAKEPARQGRLPAHPTPFLPGTEAKMAVMRDRANRKESCFHPDDAMPDDGSRNTVHHTETDDDD